MVKVPRVAADDRLQEPQSPAWDALPETSIALEPTPLTAQPSVYVQAKWKTQAYGVTKQLSVRAAHDGSRIFFHLAWSDASQSDSIRDTDQFTDAAAILFPVNADAALQSMGSPQDPVNAWYWRPDFEQPLSITAQGTGTTRRNEDPDLTATFNYDTDKWAVVLHRKLGTDQDGSAQLAAASARKVGFAVWQGSNQERGGLKAVTLDWQPLEIDA